MAEWLPFRLTQDTVLDASGGGSIRFQPSIGEWKVEQVSARTSTFVNEPEFSAYVSGMFVGGSYSGSRTNDTTFNQRISAQDNLTGVWVGGDAGATATMVISGVKLV